MSYAPVPENFYIIFIKLAGFFERSLNKSRCRCIAVDHLERWRVSIPAQKRNERTVVVIL